MRARSYLVAAAVLAVGCGSSSANNHAAAGSSGAASSGGAGAASGGAANNGGAASTTARVVITPQVATVPLAGTVQFMAIVTGNSDRTVTWSTQETGASAGTVTQDGRYTAPSVAGKVHVVATSNGDKSLSGIATVTVTAPQGTPPVLTPGVWKDITPPAPGFSSTFGSTNVEVSPVDPATIYVSIDTLGLWKSTDAGSNWQVLGTPPAKAASAGSLTTPYLDSPVRVEVDPGDPQHIYATQGVRGTALGFWVSHDAGNTWAVPQGFFAASAMATLDVTALAIDPSDFKHILLGSHSAWPNLSNGGVMESKDGGDTWVLHPPVASWPVGSQGINFLYDPASGQGDSNTWLVATDGNGFWRTADAGGTWTQVTPLTTPHGGAQIYYAKDGTLYSGAAEYPVRSKDNGLTWEQVQDGLPYYYYYSVVGDGNTLYTQLSYTGTNGKTGADAMQPYMTAPEASGGPWTAFQGGTQTFIDGPLQMYFDSANGIMYSANWGGGIWALKVIKP